MSPMLEAIAREVAADWGLPLGTHFASSPWSYVVAAGERFVLKVRDASDIESDHDVDALLRWDGRGAIRVVRHDRERRAMLLERASPGDDLASLPSAEAIDIAIAVARQLWIPAGAPFRSVHEFVPTWLADVNASDHVRRLYAELGRREDTLVHGDLHHHNLVSDGERWLAIDSKAMLCEPAFDVVPLLWNPIGSVPSERSIAECFERFVASGLDRERVMAWAVIRATYLGQPEVVTLLGK